MKQGLWMAVSLGAVAASQPVQAQETLDSEIVVTAQKREQALIDVPQSVSVVSGATLEQQQAVTFQDFAKLVPGLQLEQSNAGEGRLVLRGINTGGVASTVATYIDERSEEHTSELQSLMRISYAVFCLKKKNIYNKDSLQLHIK